MIYALVIRGCRVLEAEGRGGWEFEHRLLSCGERASAPSGPVDNTRTVMRLITIRRIEWQPQTYFSNIKRAVIREIGYYALRDTLGRRQH